MHLRERDLGLHRLLLCGFSRLRFLCCGESVMVQMSMSGSCAVKFVQSLEKKQTTHTALDQGHVTCSQGWLIGKKAL